MGSMYIVCNLDSTLLHTPVTAFQVVLYFACCKNNAPNLDLFIDISTEHMHELEYSTATDPDDPEVVAVIAEDQAEDEDDEDFPKTQQVVLYPFSFISNTDCVHFDTPCNSITCTLFFYSVPTRFW